jgi:hypothetical protein
MRRGEYYEDRFDAERGIVTRAYGPPPAIERVPLRERFRADPAYRLLSMWHRRSWRSSLAMMRARMRRWAP